MSPLREARRRRIKETQKHTNSHNGKKWKE
jgi:hypothetical protein